MSCSRPLLGFPTGALTKNGKPEYKIRSSESISELEIVLKENPDVIIIPCGKCMECRLAYSKHWADRMMLELETQKKAIFITLTYDNNHIVPSTWQDIVPNPYVYYPTSKNEVWNDDGTLSIPKDYTLVKRDCQLWIKRLRRAFPELRFRFYLAGEYGEKTLRPHYHCILYGLSVDDFVTCDRGVMCHECSIEESLYKGHCEKFMVKVPAGRNELGDQYYISPLLSSIWKNGFVLFSDVTWKTCAYVARYVTKKYGGSFAVDYDIRNCQPEFSLMSRKPGIGYKYFEEHPECVDYQNIYLGSTEGNLKINIPSYYLRKLELTNKEKCDKIKANRKEASIESMKLKLENTSLQQLDYLDNCAKIRNESIKALKRNKL